MDESDVEFSFQGLQLFQRTIQAAPPDQQLVMVFVILAEESAVDGKDAELSSAHLRQFDRPARGVARPASNAFEVCVMPGKERRHFLREVWLGTHD